MFHRSVSRMDDLAIIAHFEKHHNEAIEMSWPKTGLHRRLGDRSVWIAYHDHLHKSPRRAGHDHKNYTWTGWEIQNMTQRHTAGTVKWEQRTPCSCLHPPTHQPDCTGRQGLVVLSGNGGSTAQDELWRKLVYCIDLLKGAQKDNAETSGYARGLATALAYIRSPLSPDVDAIRKEAMEMWRKKHNAN